MEFSIIIINKKKLWKIPYKVLTPPSPPIMEIFYFFFLKLGHVLKTFVKSVFSPLKIKKNDETIRQANFCLLRCQILQRQ